MYSIYVFRKRKPTMLDSLRKPLIVKLKKKKRIKIFERDSNILASSKAGLNNCLMITRSVTYFISLIHRASNYHDLL